MINSWRRDMNKFHEVGNKILVEAKTKVGWIKKVKNREAIGYECLGKYKVDEYSGKYYTYMIMTNRKDNS
ncbi:hypothetical protein [Priestia flexa]|uniref:hypothetical protein n=1 Tax=Priestia flexa TaxID=86664 RepID=UPI0004734439|nr:hypothetical protein [Priestia flexa]